jgi:hypothetical protein
LKEKEKAYYQAKQLSLITFGAPRVGNKNFAKLLNDLVISKKLIRNYRAVKFF